MVNPISPETRGKIYLAGVIVGIFSVVSGPLMVALAVPAVWVAVITSFVGAVTAGASLLAKDNLTIPETPECVGSSLEES